MNISKSVSHRKLWQGVEVPGRGRMFTESPEGDDSFPPAVASYEAVDGWLVYKGRNGSEGIIVGSRQALTKWMADVDAMMAKHPLDTEVPWDPDVHGGEANVAACLKSAQEVLRKFGLPLKYKVWVSTNPMGASHAGNGALQLTNVHKTHTTDFLGGVHVPYGESCGAHEASHLGFSARHDRGHRVIEVLKAREKQRKPYLSLYHAWSGHMEGTAEAGAFYTLKPQVLKREAPEVYAVVAWWFGDGPEPER